MSDLPLGEHAVQLGVALVDAGVHAAAQPGVAVLEAVDQRLRAQPGPAVAQVLEPQRLQRDAVGVAVEREGLHDAAWADLVEAAVERVLVAVVHRDVAPAAAGPRVPVLDPGGHGVGAYPPGEQRRIGVGAEQLLGCGREVTLHPDDRYLLVGLDDRLRGLVHALLPSIPPGRRPGGGNAARPGPGGARSRCPSGRGPGSGGAPAGAAGPAGG